jgi:hypothetical protein
MTPGTIAVMMPLLSRTMLIPPLRSAGDSSAKGCTRMAARYRGKLAPGANVQNATIASVCQDDRKIFTART